ncbi:some similarities with uniprot [Nakaseomyces bracarensis]|uniref:Some similarities with uniprot n=1 Tax=Nakaseomyces bracarensis TaxID=273131 RepID=A0ABR4P0S4_9SACH
MQLLDLLPVTLITLSALHKVSAYDSNIPNPFPLGCSPESFTSKPGLVMELWDYSYVNPYQICPNGQGTCPISGNYGTCWDDAYLNPDYSRNGYQSHQKFAKIDGVTGNLDFRFTPDNVCVPKSGTLPDGFNYKNSFTLSNFTMILYGYFKPKVTGQHTFSFKGDDLVYINFGANNAFDCCNHELTADDFGNYQAYSIWPDNINTRSTLEVYLHEDYYYPIRIFFNNRDNVAALDLDFTADGGVTTITDFTDYFFWIDDKQGGCPGKIAYSTTCKTGYESTTTFSTNYETDSPGFGALPITKTTYFVQVPCKEGEDCHGGFYDPIAHTCSPPTNPNECTDMTANRIDGLSVDLYEYQFLNPLVPCANGVGLDGQQGYCPQNGPLVNDQCWKMDYLDDKDYPYSTYAQNPKIGHVDGVAGSFNIFFRATYDCVVENGKLPNNYHYDKDITMTNFSMVLTGYFKPQQSGTHVFSMSGDDILNVDFGDAVDLSCCMPPVTSDSVKNHNSFQSVWPRNYPEAQMSLNLEADKYYPIRVFYTNRDKNALIDFTVVTPDGVRRSDLTGFTYSFKSCQ